MVDIVHIRRYTARVSGEWHEVVLCDIDADKLERNAVKHGIPTTCPSLDVLCETDVSAVVIITQPWLHAPQAIQALHAGKHVYSAVPTGRTVKEITSLVEAVKETGKAPPNNVWDAARYALPGIIAHEPATRGGILLEVPDLGDPPA